MALTDDRVKLVESLFHAARERPPVDREAFLDAACGGDPSLREEVASLLVTVGTSFFDRAVNGVLHSVSRAPLTGRQFGAYLMGPMLGAGGMGEVYRARDTKLNRDVALKILPTWSATDPERLARFKREAQVLAALDHPNIGAIYGFEDTDGTHALVLQLVEGPTLADRIAQGPLPIDEALTIARQIAGALEAAHEQGIVHRDLKPANIKVTSNGRVKVLDFGLAKLLETDAAGSARNGELTHPPTITTPAMTMPGMILGTAGYMSPEQAKGQRIDARTDVWAFGCVLYEMLTQRRAFEGGAVLATLARVIERDPDWRALPSSTPATIEKLIRRCLTKDQTDRLRNMGDARLEIVDALLVPKDSGEKRSLWLVARWWHWAALGVMVAVTAGALAWAVRRSVAPLRTEPAMEFGVKMPDGYAVRSLAVSPDSRHIAAELFVNSADVWVHSLESGESQRVPGSEGYTNPFWAPDSSRSEYDVTRDGGRLLERQAAAAQSPAIRVILNWTERLKP